MAYSTSKRSLCKACNEAPSVFFCQGCQQDFCTNHAREHRQELSKQLETIILEHDQLKQNLTEYTQKSNRHPLMKEIDQWETESIAKIRKAANEARKQLSNIAGNNTTEIANDLKQLTTELSAARTEDNFIEIDLKEWMEKLQQYTRELNAPSSIHIQQEKGDTPFIQKITVCIGKKGSFEEVMGNVQIEDNGQVIMVVSNGHSTARFQGDYSSGQHRFRFKIEQKHSSNWILFGIVSKNTPIQTSSYNTPTSFGWVTNSYAVLNRVGQLNYNGFESDINQNDTVELLIDCDQQKICLTNERTNRKHEINVDVTQCPFPWIVHVGLYYENDRVRFLPS